MQGTADLVATLDSASLDRWLAVAFDATQAELTGAPALPADSVSAEAAVLHIVAHAKPEEQDPLLDAWVADTNTDEEACWTARRVYGRLRELPASEQPDYARAVATVEGFGLALLRAEGQPDFR